MTKGIASAFNWCRESMRMASELNVGLLAAGVAFFGLLAFFPAMGTIVTLWGLFADPGFLESQIGSFEEIVPAAATQVVGARLHALTLQPKPTLGLASATSFLVAVWVSRVAVSGLIRAMNTVYGTRVRGGFRHNTISLGLTFLLMGIAIVAIASVIFIPLAGQVFLNAPPPGPGVEVLRWCVALVTVSVGLAIVYRYGPNRKPPLTPWVSPGGVLVILFWSLASWSFANFLQLHERYDVVYGSLGTAVALLLWFYITAYLVVLGGLLNARIEQEQADER